MYAVEFETYANEPTITIPEFEKFKGKEIRVIILDKETKRKRENDLDFFDKFRFDLNHFHFDRDEANAR